MAPAKILIIDPLTLMGREFVDSAGRLGQQLPEMDFRHTAIEDEHEIVELGNGPALVPPLNATDELEGYDAVVLTSDELGSRHDHLFKWMDERPDAALVDISRLEPLLDRTTPSDGSEIPETRHLRVANPAIVAAARVIRLLEPLDVRGGTLAVVEPVSVHGRGAIELMAQQAGQRLQGAEVGEMIYDHVRAFNEIAIDSGDLAEEAARVLPGFPLAVTRSLAGAFHGHLAYLGVNFAHPLERDEFDDVFSQTEAIELTVAPMRLDLIPDNDRPLMLPPVLSLDGTQAAMTLMMDGLRVGGALTAIEILQKLS